LDEVGFVDQKKHEPNDPWDTLLKFLNFPNGLDAPSSEKTRGALQRTLSKIRKIVKGLFATPIEGNPIPPPHPIAGYVLAFNFSVGGIILDSIPGRSWDEVSVSLDETRQTITFQRPAIITEYSGPDRVDREIIKSTSIPWTLLSFTLVERKLLSQLHGSSMSEASVAPETVLFLNKKLKELIPVLAGEPISYHAGAWCAAFR
jgi:hypothetical protein